MTEQNNYDMSSEYFVMKGKVQDYIMAQARVHHCDGPCFPPVQLVFSLIHSSKEKCIIFIYSHCRRVGHAKSEAVSSHFTVPAFNDGPPT